MKTVVCRIDWGATRQGGYTLFEPSSLEFEETTMARVKALIKMGEVNGLLIDESGEVVPDIEGWNMPNLIIKSAVGNYRSLFPQTIRNNTIYSVVQVYDMEGHGRTYEVINNFCMRCVMTEKQVLGLAMFNTVGGIRLDGEKIELCEGVKVINTKVGKWSELVNSFMQDEEGVYMGGEGEPKPAAENTMPAAESIDEGADVNVGTEPASGEPPVEPEGTEAKTMEEIFNGGGMDDDMGAVEHTQGSVEGDAPAESTDQQEPDATGDENQGEVKDTEPEKEGSKKSNKSGGKKKK